MGKGFRFTFAYTVDDLETVRRSCDLDVAGVEVSTDHYIGGERVASAERFVDLSPIDERPLAEVARGGAARGRPRRRRPRRRRSPRGRRSGPPARAVHLHRLADLIDANVERLAAVECLDMAMLLRSLRARVIARGARNFRAYADLAAALRGARVVVERHREPRASAARRARRS